MDECGFGIIIQLRARRGTNPRPEHGKGKTVSVCRYPSMRRALTVTFSTPQNPLGTSGDTAVEFLLSPQRAILDLRLIHDGLFISVAPGDLFAFRAGRWAWKKKKKKPS